MQLDSRRQGSAKDYVVQELIHDIVNIKLKPGEKLCEPALCERFGVSRTPFREAELELAQRKLIVVRPKIGTFVSFIDKELVEEVRHLRSVLEAELAVMACSMLTKKDIVYRNNAADIKMIVCAGEEIITKHIIDAMPDSPTFEKLVSVGPDIPEGFEDFH